MRKKLLAMDLDGTAVRDDYSMGEHTRAAIREAREQGHIAIFVSGRRDIDMLTLSEEEMRCVDYQILYNGGKILRNYDGFVLHRELIPPEACMKLIQHCLDLDLQLHICNGLTWQITVLTDEAMEYAGELGISPKVIRSLREVDWEKGLECFMATRDSEAIGRYIDNFLPGVYYVNSEPGCIDIMPAGATKWHGVKKLASTLGIPREDIIAIGNYYNDIDMIRNSGIGIAVANALEDVKQEADYVTENDNNHDAVAEVIHKMLAGAYERTCGKEERSCETVFDGN